MKKTFQILFQVLPKNLGMLIIDLSESHLCKGFFKKIFSERQLTNCRVWTPCLTIEVLS